MPKRTRAYEGTNVNFAVSQSQINKLLNAHEIQDIQYTTISYDTATASGLTMEKGTQAIMLVFQKHVKMPDGQSGNIPVRVVVPNVPPERLNQYYRLLFWYVKSKFEAIDSGLVEFAEEFMAHLQIADKSGVSRLWDRFKRGFYKTISSGGLPDANLLPGYTDPDKEVK